MATVRARLTKVKDDPASFIDPDVVRAACLEHKHRFRDRLLDPVRALRVFATQVAHGNTAISHVVRLFDGEFSEAAYCRARARVPVSVLEAMLRRSGSALTDRPRGGATLWLGHRIVLIDGTGISAPDTPALRAYFGVPSAVGDGCGLPLVKALLVCDARTGRALDVHISPSTTGELRHASELHPALQSGDVLVGDRGLVSYRHLAQLANRGCDGVFRLPKSWNVSFPAPSTRDTQSPGAGKHGKHEAILIQRIGDDDQVVEMQRPRNRPEYVSKEQWESLPDKLTLRVLRYTVEGSGVRTKRVTLVSTLTDARKYSAQALAELYQMRWRVEQNFRHLKRTMGMDRLKCQSVDGVKREILMFCLVYNAVCAVRAAEAERVNTEPTRLSFVDTLRAVVAAASPLSKPTPNRPPIKKCPKRPPRLEPRQLKRRHSEYRVMTLPRAELRKRVAEKLARLK